MLRRSDGLEEADVKAKWKEHRVGYKIILSGQTRSKLKIVVMYCINITSQFIAHVDVDGARP